MTTKRLVLLSMLVACGGGGGDEGGPGGVRRLAEQLDTPDHLVADADHIYWSTEPGLVQRVAKSGGTIETLVDLQSIVSDLEVDDQYVYALNGSLSRAPKTGGARELLVDLGSMNCRGRRMTDSGDALLVACPGTSNIVRVAKSGGDPTVVTTTSDELRDDIVADAAHAYFASGHDLYSVALPSGTPTMLANSADEPVDLVLDGDGLVWSEANYQSDRCAQTTEGLARVAAGAKTVLIGDACLFEDIASDGSNVFISTGSTIKRIASTGGTAETVISRFEKGGEFLKTASLVVDDTDVYWASRENTPPHAILAIDKTVTEAF